MFKLIMKNIIPSIITSIFTGIYVIIDGFFVGQKLGSLGLAALNVAWPVTAFLQAIGLGVGIASGIMISIDEAKKENKYKNILSNTFYLLIGLSILSLLILTFVKSLLFILGADNMTIGYCMEYVRVILFGSLIQIVGSAMVPILRNIGHTKYAALSLVVGGLFNFIGDYIFIFHLNLGLTGAAIASMFGAFMSAFMCILMLIKEKKFYMNQRIEYQYQLKLLNSSVAPFALMYAASILLIINNIFCYKYGSNSAIAAYTVLAYVLFIVQYAAQGISDGIQPLFSYYYGLNKKEEIKKIFILSLIITTVFITFITILTILLKNQFAIMFNIDDDAIKIYNDAYYYFVGGYLFLGIVRIVLCRFYATKEIIKADLLVILEPLIITPILLIILCNSVGLKGIWLSFMITQIILSIISILMIFIKKRSEI